MTQTSQEDWPTPLTLPGQAAAVAGPVDVNMMYVLHHAFRRDLDTFVKAAERTPVSDREAWQALSRRWEVFSVELHRHHRHEDEQLWPVLRSKTDDDGRAVLDAMEHEHAGIDPILRDIGTGFAALSAAPDETARTSLVESLMAGQANLDGHLAHEERAAIPLIQTCATQQDWDDFEKAAQKEGGIRGLLSVVPWAAYGLEPALRDELFAGAPAITRLVWRLTHGRFDRKEAATFRYVPTVGP